MSAACTSKYKTGAEFYKLANEKWGLSNMIKKGRRGRVIYTGNDERPYNVVGVVGCVAAIVLCLGWCIFISDEENGLFKCLGGMFLVFCLVYQSIQLRWFTTKLDDMSLGEDDLLRCVMGEVPITDIYWLHVNTVLSSVVIGMVCLLFFGIGLWHYSAQLGRCSRNTKVNVDYGSTEFKRYLHTYTKYN
jgi:hypothetical protein